MGTPAHPQSSRTPRPEDASKAPGSQFVNFLFLRIDPAFKTLESNEKLVAKQQFLDAYDRFHGKPLSASYSLVGLRADCDLLLWRMDPQLETLQEMSSLLSTAGIGRFLLPAYSYLATTQPPASLDRLSLEPAASAAPPIPGRHRYLFVQPFSKSREWRRLSRSERQKIVEEQVRMRSSYPGVLLHAAYAAGLDDPEVVLAFETDRLADYQELASEIRESAWSDHALRDAPAFTCVSRDLRDILDSLG